MISKIKAFKENKGLMKYFSNTSWLFAEKILRMIVGLFVGIWVARYLGPDRFGLLSYAGSFVGLFSAIATLGLDGIAVRELVKYPGKEYSLMTTVFILKLFGGILTLLVLYIAVQVTSNDTYTNMLIFIIASATIFQSFNVIDLYFQAKVMSKYVVISNIISLFISSLVKIVLIVVDAPLEAFAWVVLFDSLVLALGFIYFFLKHSQISIRYLTFDKMMAAELLRDSWPLILSGMVIAVYMKIDQVMIKEMLDNEAVGNYAAAVRLSEAWYFIPMVISASLFPAIINAKKVSEKLYHDRLQKLYDFLVWMAIAIAIPMSYLSDWIVDLLFGSKYSDAGNVLVIHIWTGVFVFLGVASSKWFVAENLQKYSFYRTLAGAIINVFLNFLLIPRYSIHGAAIATLISQAIASYIFNLTNKKLWLTFQLQTYAVLLPIRLIRSMV